MTDAIDLDARAHREADNDIRRARGAGWNPRFGDAPYEHGEFVEGIKSSFTRPDEPEGGDAFMPDSQECADALAALEGEVGFHEGPDNTNPYGPWQGVSNAAWCDSFAQWGAVEHGKFQWPSYCQFGGKGDAYCPFTKDHAKALRYWRGRDETPRPGWQVLFSWNGNGVPDHIGTVIHNMGDGMLRTVEGNYQDAVAYVDRDYDYVVGFVELPWGAGEEHDEGPLLLRRGYVGEEVRAVQQRLADLKYDLGPCGVDGDYGVATENAVRAFQQDHHDVTGAPLEVDGIVGPRTWDALHAASSPG